MTLMGASDGPRLSAAASRCSKSISRIVDAVDGPVPIDSYPVKRTAPPMVQSEIFGLIPYAVIPHAGLDSHCG